MKPRRAHLFHPSVILTLGLFVGSMLMARGVYVVYPFSRFDMYARANGNLATRLAIRDRAGQFSEPTQWDHFRCDAPINLDPHRCGENMSNLNYTDREISDHIQSHVTTELDPRDEPVTLVRRVWRIDPWVPEPAHSVCELHACTARRAHP